MSDRATISWRVLGPAPRRRLALLDFAAPWQAVWRHRHVIAHLGRRQVQVRHRGSYLGWTWTLLHPLLLLGVYTLVFTVLLPVGGGPGQRLDFALRVFCGLVVFGVFSETVQRAPLSVVGHPNYVKKMVFPLEALPLADLWASSVCGALNLLVLLVAVLGVHGTLPATALLFPLVVPPLLLLSAGAAWLLASLGVFVRDLGASIGVLVTMLFFLTPVIYRLEDVPQRWQWLAAANPMAGLVEAARATLLEGRAPAWGPLAMASVVAVVVAHLGFAWFRATKRGFADVV